MRRDAKCCKRWKQLENYTSKPMANDREEKKLQTHHITWIFRLISSFFVESCIIIWVLLCWWARAIPICMVLSFVFQSFYENVAYKVYPLNIRFFFIISFFPSLSLSIKNKKGKSSLGVSAKYCHRVKKSKYFIAFFDQMNKFLAF